MATHPDKAAYAVTKHAALALSEWLALTYRPRGIKVSCFCPGAMRTPMLMADGIPTDHPAVQNAATPEEVAELLVLGIGAEQFLIVDSTVGTDSLTAKGANYEHWISDIACVINS